MAGPSQLAIKYVLIGKGMNPADADKFSKLGWVQKYAELAQANKLPPGLPELNEANITKYKELAKKSGVPFDQYVQSKFAPETMAKAEPPAAPTPPTAQPTVGDAPQMPALGGIDAPLGWAPTEPTAAMSGLPPVDQGIGGFQQAAADQQLYRKPYQVTEKDLSDAAVNKIYGESEKGLFGKDPAGFEKSVGAVIDSTLNRVGSEGRGPSGSINDVLFSFGHNGKKEQYTANIKLKENQAPPEAAAQIRSMITERASGTVPDSIGGSTEYRSKDLKSWGARENAVNIGGNLFAPRNKTAGPHAPDPNVPQQPMATMQPELMMGGMGVGTQDLAPVAAASTREFVPTAPVLGAPQAPDVGMPLPGRKPAAPTATGTVPTANYPNLSYSKDFAGKTRNIPVDPIVASQFQKTASNMGLQVEFTSGGQTGDRRTGSHRHDVNPQGERLMGVGGAAGDFHLTKDGRTLSSANPEDRAIISEFMSSMVSEGNIGIGAGKGEQYMGSDTFHVGGYDPSPKGVKGPLAWGHKGRSAAAPGWVKEALATGLETPPIPTVSPARAERVPMAGGAPQLPGTSVTDFNSLGPQIPGPAGWFSELGPPPQSAPETAKFVSGGDAFGDVTNVTPYSEQFNAPDPSQPFGFGEPTPGPLASPPPTLGGAPAGPAGTTPSPTEPNTYVPGQWTPEQFYQPPAAPAAFPEPPPFNPTAAPTLAAPSPNEMTSPFAFAPPAGFSTQISPFDPNLATSNTGWPYPQPDVGMPTANPMRVAGEGGFAPSAGETAPTFDPTQGASTVGSAPPMPSWAMPGAYGMPGASSLPIGGFSPMQYAGGTSVPTSMAASEGQYSGTAINPATLGQGGSGGPILGAFGPTGSFGPGGTGPDGFGPQSEGVSWTPSGQAGSSASMESHALQLMAAQDAANRINTANAFAKASMTGPGGGGPVLATIGGSDVMGLTGGLGINKGLQSMWDMHRKLQSSMPQMNYGMNVGFGGNF